MWTLLLLIFNILGCIHEWAFKWFTTIAIARALKNKILIKKMELKFHNKNERKNLQKLLIVITISATVCAFNSKIIKLILLSLKETPLKHC